LTGKRNLNLPGSGTFCCSSACCRCSFLLGSSSFFGAVFGAGFLTRLALPRFSIYEIKFIIFFPQYFSYL
jgi:hypothetical protein